MAQSKKKITTAIVAGVTAVSLLLGGTFAWQSINQTALNEASDVINPGGRLHDDFDGKNKDVYVENFADDPIFARVRLDEYFEIVMNKGAGDAEKIEVVTTGATKGETDTYVTHIFGGDNATDPYWNWTTGGSTVYMPTFNKDKDSLKADINGTYNGLDGVVTDDTDDDRYTDYIEYADGETKTADAAYDADTDNIDNNGTTAVEETHTAISTLGATLMSMQEWMDEGSPVGEYWVYDTDGWVYWADAIQPDTATGLLLDEIKLAQVMDDSWYYAINVVAQFVTADDLGKNDGTGFYDTQNGTVPSADALALLEKIGVNTEGPTAVSDDASLRDALEAGDDIVINGTIESTTIETKDDINFNYDYLWHDGGTLSGGTLNLNSGSDRGLFINNENNWPESGDGANEATLKDTTINADSKIAVYVQAINAPVNLENVNITSDNAGLYVNMGSETVTLDNVTIDSANNDTIEGEDWFNTAVVVATNDHVVINSGSYTGDNAVYVLSSGGTVEINGGYFDGAVKADAGTITITGGTFTADPTEFVADGYEVVTNDDNTYTVQEKEQSSTSRIMFEGVAPDERNWVGVTSDITAANVTIYDENGNPYVTGEGAEYLMCMNMGSAFMVMPGMIENGNEFLTQLLSEFDDNSTSCIAFGITKATGEHLIDYGNGMMVVSPYVEDAMVWESIDYVFYDADDYTFNTTYTYTDEDFSEGIEFYVFTSTENNNAHVIETTDTWADRGINDTGIPYSGDVSVLNGDILRDYIVSEPVVTVRCNNDEGVFTAGNTYTFTATFNSQTSFTWTVTKDNEVIYTETTESENLKNSTYDLTIPADVENGSYEITVETSVGKVNDTFEFTVS